MCFKCNRMPDSCEYIKRYFVAAPTINTQCFRSNISLKKKCFINSDKAYKQVTGVQILKILSMSVAVLLTAATSWKSYSTKFISGRQKSTVLLGLSTGVAFKQNSKTFTFPSVTPQQTTPDRCGASDNMLSRYQNRSLPIVLLYFPYLGNSSMIILDTEFQPVDASPLG